MSDKQEKSNVVPPAPPNCPYLFESEGKTYFQCQVQEIDVRFCLNEEDGIDRPIVAAVALAYWAKENKRCKGLISNVAMTRFDQWAEWGGL